jgi:hypothetical protein
VATDIVRSVGAWSRGGVNRRADVLVVQTLLKAAAASLKTPAYDPGKIDGLIRRPPQKSPTIKAIIEFQKSFMRHPDGVVEPGGLTLRALQSANGVVVPTPPPPPPMPPVAAPPGLTRVAFPGTVVALVVRGKTSPTHAPGNMEQHADCVLSNGAPVGFFGTGGGASASSGMGLSGVVADHAWFKVHRLSYVDLATAKKYGMVSTLLTVDATVAQVALFESYWTTLATSPGNFNILGNNCSTHASDAFISSGILGSGIPGLDTPDNLYRQLVAALGARTKSYSGYVGFTPAGAAFDVDVQV